MLKRKNYWQFPQGGIDGNENVIEAAKREAWEETGIKNLELIKISDKTNSYIWNNTQRKFTKNRKFQNKGQTQHIAYFRSADEIRVDNHEFINFKWVKISDLDKVTQSERAALTKIVMEDLKDLA
jgi:putative (di)nucleoside polyphosphate hydrolase